MQIFFLNRLWRLLKNGHLPIKLHSSAPPPPPGIFPARKYSYIVCGISDVSKHTSDWNMEVIDPTTDDHGYFSGLQS